MMLMDLDVLDLNKFDGIIKYAIEEKTVLIMLYCGKVMSVHKLMKP